jgi:hypothetical protein
VSTREFLFVRVVVVLVLRAGHSQLSLSCGATILGEGWYLLDVQAHYAIPSELVEAGQLIAMHVPPGKYK